MGSELVDSKQKRNSRNKNFFGPRIGIGRFQIRSGFPISYSIFIGRFAPYRHDFKLTKIFFFLLLSLILALCALYIIILHT